MFFFFFSQELLRVKTELREDKLWSTPTEVTLSHRVNTAPETPR